jgi:F-type H+-transporting ATPase subunit delta
MSARESAARYARALLDVAIRESDPEQVNGDLARFADLVATNLDLREALTHPAVPTAGKHRLVAELARRLQLRPPVDKLLLMLAERDRLALLPDLVDIYRERLLDYQQVLRADVTTAAPLTAERMASLRERLSQATGKRVTMTAKVDPALIGGVVARIGSTVYDGSVATQLEKMREKLLQET